MNIGKPVVIDDSISAYLEENFFRLFNRTRNLHNDYWYIWLKSGLLRFVCRRLRKKYNIPKLAANEDYQNIEKFVGDKSVTIGSYAFFDKWNKRKQFKKELESIILQLRLHRSAYWSLFNNIFYGTPLSLKEKWEGYDTESVFHITSPLEDEFLPLGYTIREIEIIRNDIISNLTSHYKKKLSDRQLMTINNWCNRLKRNIRAPKSKKLIYLVIKQMKKYKTFAKGLNEDNDLIDRLRQTSKKCAANIAAEMPDNVEYFDHTAYRQMVLRLNNAFPILNEFVYSQ